MKNENKSKNFCFYDKKYLYCTVLISKIFTVVVVRVISYNEQKKKVRNNLLSVLCSYLSFMFIDYAYTAYYREYRNDFFFRSYICEGGSK